MPSKVGGFDNRPVQIGTDRVAGKRSASVSSDASSASGASNSSAGNVQITDSARQLAALEAAIKELPAVDEAKVAELRTAIESGTYHVQPERIAEKLLNTERQLNDPPSA